MSDAPQAAAEATPDAAAPQADPQPAPQAASQAAPPSDGQLESPVELDAPPPPVAAVVDCPVCGTPTSAGEAFCESCGADLGRGTPLAEDTPDPEAAPIEITSRSVPAGPARAAGVVVVLPDLDARATTCLACGGSVAEDGYCEQCGTPARRPRDHFVELPVPWVGGVCDKGIRHARNEDAMALAGRPEPASWAAVVVCDGVSSAPQSDVAALAASRAARDVLSAPESEPPLTADELLTRAAAAANDAATKVAVGVKGPNPPSCTFVAALVESGRAVVAWIGDSRAYWFPDGGTAVQISTDDSWAAEAMAHGLSREEAEKLPQAHAITRWLGADSPEGPPRTVTVDVSAPGWLLVCSDGLWNYCSAPEDLGALLTATQARVGAEPVALAEALTMWANEQGGHDNITTALVRCG
ncbi:PP2C family serine/threonine-protein phosphatase [Kineosporia sp. A_224]|uniref:PP2C family protein-serine/threonine phosphatase n=1 Tax=Kineosporia sp. A_224 TaxID=1962180 RepID=UPI000B4B3580|nr:PP2C family protein-serine/threonine phosphatase [Kineosporia sp. A_224]